MKFDLDDIQNLVFIFSLICPWFVYHFKNFHYIYHSHDYESYKYALNDLEIDFCPKVFQHTQLNMVFPS